MKYSDTLKEAWAMTHTGRGLLWYGTIPAFFTTLGGVAWLLYQYFAFQDSPFFGAEHHYIDTFTELGREIVFSSPLIMWTAVVVCAVVAVGFLVLPPFCDAALIGLVAAKHKGREIRGSDGMALGFAHFLRMFEYRAVIAIFSFVEWFTLVSIATRYFGFNTGFLILFSVLFVLSMLFYFLFVYGDNFIVLEKSPVMNALTSSAQLVGGNIKETLLMSILLLLVFVRTLINVLLLFLMPVLVIFTTGFFVSQVAIVIAVALGGLVGILALLLAAYLAGTLTVFVNAAWTLTFLKLDRHRADDLIADV